MKEGIEEDKEIYEEQKQEMSTYAAEHNTTVSRIIIEGLEIRMGKGQSL